MKTNAQLFKTAEAFAGRSDDGKFAAPSGAAGIDAGGDRRGTVFLPRFVFLILVLMMLVSGFLPAAQAQDTCTDVSTWSDLYDAMQSGGCIKLTSSVTYGAGGGEYVSKTLEVPSDITVTLDLNGKTIDRNLQSAVPDGCVIVVNSGAALTLNDTSTAQTGMITGGYANSGGGVYVNGGSFTMTGGTISGNRSSLGGGVSITHSGLAQGTFIMTGGTIKLNSATLNGGGVRVSKSSFTMSGGSIVLNSATDNGGGVYLFDNTAVMNVSGAPVIYDNRRGTINENGTMSGDINNVYLKSGNKINVNGTLTTPTAPGSTIGVTMAEPGVFTYGLTGKGSNLSFSSDANGYVVGLDDSGEAKLTTGENNERTLTYNRNGASGGQVEYKDGPYWSDHKVKLSKPGDYFDYIEAGPDDGHILIEWNTDQAFFGWNTKADGSGIAYAPGTEIYLTGDLTLYAQWGYVAQDTSGRGYSKLKDAIEDSPSDTILLLADIDSEEKAGGWPLVIPSGSDIILNLNGYNIDRNQTSPTADGYVIKVVGNLTLWGSGEIRGGNNRDYQCGGVYVNGGTFTMGNSTTNGGKITGNKGNRSGGVYVDTNGTFIMNNGEISGNESSNEGGGVYNSFGTFTMNGGTITGNTANSNGGGVYNAGGSFTIIGGKITGNEADKGGGVYRMVSNPSSFTITGGEITGNKASSAGGGIYLYGNPNNIQGDPKITGNTVNGAANNVYMMEREDVPTRLSVKDSMGNSDPIGITMQTPGVFTGSDPTNYNNAAKFTSDNSSYYVAQYIQGEPGAGQNVGQLYLNNAIPISSVAVTDIEVPAAGTALDTEAATTTSKVTLGTVTWKAGDVTVSGTTAGYDTAYTAVVTATAAEGYIFSSQATATVNGNEAKAELNSNGTLTISYTFPKLLEITTANKETVYSPDGISLPVDGMFTFSEGYNGTVTYSLANSTADTAGTGTISDGKLNVTKAGTFTIHASAAADDVNNYAGAEATAVLTVKKAEVTAPTISSKEYTGSTLTADVSDTDYYTVTTNGGGTNVQAAGYPVVLTLKDSNVYKWSDSEEAEKTLTFQITQASNSVTKPTIQGWTYGGTPKDPTGSTATFGTTNIYYVYSNEENGTYDTTVPTNAGTWYVRAEVAETTNYAGASSASTSFEIAAASLMVTAKPKTIIYGDEPANDGVEYSGFVNEESESVLGGTLTYIYSYTQFVDDVGNTYTITPSGLTSDNYDITFTPGTLTVNPKNIKPVIEVTGGPYSYKNGTPITPAFTVKDPGTGRKLTGTDYSAEITDNVNAGEGKITVTAMEGGNYTFPDTVQTFTISKVDYRGTKTASVNVWSNQENTGVTVTLPDLPDGAKYADNGTAGGTTSALISGTPSVSGTTLTFGTTAQPAATAAEITVGVTGATNYKDYDVTVTVTTADKAEAGVSINGGQDKTVTFGDAAFVLDTAVTAPGTEGTGSYQWSSGNTDTADIDPVSGTITVKAAGQTQISVTYESDNTLGTASVMLTVEPKSIAGAAVTLSEQEFNYDETEKSVTVMSVTLDGVTLTQGTDHTVSGDLSGTDVKAYTVTVTGQGNYKDSVSAEWKIVKPGFTVTWLMDDGSEIGTATVEYGEMPAHEDPVKAADAQYTWSFDHWEPALAPVKAATSYTAVFSSAVNQYSVTFVDEDGTTVLMEAKKYDYGTKAADIAKPDDPVKPATAEESFAFAGWSPEIADVTADATYKAVYTGGANQYSVTFVDEDGTTVLKEAVKYAYGTKADDIVKPADPVKPATAEESFTFAGWNPEIADVTADATYRAVYTNSTNQYSVTFVDEDGTVLMEAKEYAYGTKAEAITKPADPVKPATAEESFTFAGWSPEIADVTADATYKAVYKAEKNIFTVTVSTEGQGTASADPASGEAGTKVTLSAVPAGGWVFREWQAVSGGVTIAADNTFTLGTENAEIKAVFYATPYKSVPSDEDEPETTGNDQTYVIGSGEPRKFRIIREEDGNDSAFARFERALKQAEASGGKVMGGIRLILGDREYYPELNKDYTYTEGSVIIIFKPEYLDKLPEGKYTMETFFAEDNGEILPFRTSLSVIVPQSIKFISIKNDGSYNTPKDIDEAEYNLTILITAGDTILRQAENVPLKVQPDKKELKPDNEVEFTVLGEENTLEINAASRIVITGLPKEVIGYGPEVYDAASGTTERPVQHRYALSIRDARFGKSGEILVYLLWDDGSRPVEEIRVVALPEDEIGAYQLRPDGTKEYLLFQTYDICMAWLGSDELCRGPERCYHK